MIRLTIDGRQIQTEEGKTILEAALDNGIYIPNLCYHPDIEPIGSCRLCIVEIEQMKGFLTACTMRAHDGMIVKTQTAELEKLRKTIIWLILSELPAEPCEDTQLKKLVDWVGVENLLDDYCYKSKNFAIDEKQPLFTRDPNHCILCLRCVRMCQQIRGVGAIGVINRGIKSIVGTSYNCSLMDADCRFCSACVQVCPTDALKDKDAEKDSEGKLTLPCKQTCPAGIDIPLYVRLIAQGRFQNAFEVIRQRVPFPHVLGYVCPHPCEDACRRSELNEPVCVRELKRFVAERDDGRWKDKIEVLPDTGKKVAVIGSGPAGLTCAWFLNRLGHKVTVYEILTKAGGMMRSCIPRFRMPESVLDKEIKDIEQAGVEIKTNTKVDSLTDLFENGNDAVFIAIGAPEGMKMGIPGEDDPKVLDGISFLSKINFGDEVNVGKNVAVVGGGNVAIDVARTLPRLGAENVTILYRRTREEMPAWAEEVEYALQEGIKIEYLAAPVRIITETDRLKVECIRMQLTEPDESGRRRPVPIKGSEFVITLDSLIMAIGQKMAPPSGFDVETDKKSRLVVDEKTMTSSRKGVFCGGDAVTGPATVIEAIKAGREAAKAIDKFLGGSGEIDQQLKETEKENPRLGPDAGYPKRHRSATPVVPIGQRTKDFSVVELTRREDDALKQADRCLRCSLRNIISPVPLPPEKK